MFCASGDVALCKTKGGEGVSARAEESELANIETVNDVSGD